MLIFQNLKSYKKKSNVGTFLLPYIADSFFDCERTKEKMTHGLPKRECTPANQFLYRNSKKTEKKKRKKKEPKPKYLRFK